MQVLTRMLWLMVALCGVGHICLPVSAQETPRSPRQRLRRVTPTPAPPAPGTSTPPMTPDEPSPAVDDDEVVRVDTNLTNILLTAIDKERRFITTLRREDVRVLENGTPQEISTFQRETDLPLSLAVLIDASESQRGVLPFEKTTARAFLESVIRPDKDQAAIVSFTGLAVLEQPLTNETAKMERAIDRIEIVLPLDSDEDDATPANTAGPMEEDKAVGYTGIWDAIWGATNEVLSQTPERTRRAIILLTDGDDTSSQTKKQEAIAFAVKHNIAIYSIGIRDAEFPDGELKKGTLRDVSEKTGGRAFFPQSETELRAAFKQIEDELRSQYLIAYSPTNKLRDGSFRQVRLEIINPELRKQKMSLLYRQGYYARQPSASR